ncbi:MAG: urease accessory protein UreE [Hyphomicrobiales bacterium]|nr:MAG: urease accessory protein UreE [Hyphomicrobiales bacterium]
MLRATSVVRKAAVRQDRVVDTLTLDHDDRNRRRLALKADGGLDLLLDLDKATAIGDGDAVKLEDGRLVLVKAAPQSLLEIRAENPLRLMRVAWHIGNRHTPAEITADAIYIENDHVLAEMVRGQGCAMNSVMRPFQPERGAYDHDHANCDHPSHDHGSHGQHGHDHHDRGPHAHAHGEAKAEHGHAHSHAEAHTHTHAQGDACGCGHDHGHHDHGHKHGAEHGHKGHTHDH